MIRKLLLALAFIGLLASAQAQNYNATAGSGLVFGAKTVGSAPAVLYPYGIICDTTTITQCLGVNASGQITIANTTFAATESGTWTVQPGNTANTTAWLVTGTGGTFPATQSGTWTVQPGNTANTTAWLVNIGAMGGTNISSTCVVTYGGTPTGSCPSATVFVSNTNANGQATMANSSPVVIASNQSAVPVTLTSTTVTGTVAAVGPIAVGSANANPPVVIGGTATGAAGANVQGLSIVAPSVAPVTATNTAGVFALRPDSPGIITLGPAAPANAVPTIPSSPYPGNATAVAVPINASSGNVAAGTAAATLAAAASKFTYMSGFQFTSSGSTAASVVVCTITGITTTKSYIVASALGALLANTPLIVQFNPPLQSSAVNTAIVASCPSLGTGNTNAVMTADGYQL
jgi:hypothetical protein